MTHVHSHQVSGIGGHTVSHVHSSPHRQGQELDVADGLPTVGGAWPQRSVTTGGVTVRYA